MKTIKIFGLLSVCLWLAVNLSAFEWPTGEKRVATSFGQNMPGGFNTGIDILGKDEPVFPIADGEIIFTYDETNNYTSLPRGAGSFMILYHQGDIHSVYSHLKRGSLQIPSSAQVRRQDALGAVGNTGASLGGSLFLQIIDIEENMLLNPLKQLTPEIQDNTEPLIEKILFQRNNLDYKLVNGSIVTPGRVSLLIDTKDILRDRLRSFYMFAPYTITLSQNGVEVFRLAFDAIKVEENRFVLNSTGQGYKDVYTPEGLIKLGELNLVQGITRFRFLVGDYAPGGGNSVAAEYKVTVAGE